MGLFDIFKNKTPTTNALNIKTPPETVKEIIEENLDDLVLTEGELADLTEGVLNTESKISIAKFKHNLSILISEAKNNKRISKFKMIREDDAFPQGWEWHVNSHNTVMYPQCLHVSLALKRQYIIEKYNLEKGINGIELPIKEDEIQNHMSELDFQMGFVLMPPIFFSTKHFTVNTALGSTGSYNFVKNDRNFIIVDDMNNFFASDYGYSVSKRDAYLDVTHEGLPISENAIVLIREDRYKDLIKDPIVSEELKMRKIILFKGDKDVAINMVLTSLGVLPTAVSHDYAEYNQELESILDRSFEELAEKNNLLYDRSHAGDIREQKGHFSNYYDDQNRDFSDYLRDFVSFMVQKFPEQEVYFNREFKLGENFPTKAVKEIGVQNLLNAINEYNDRAKILFEERKNRYLNERKSITPEMHKIFADTVQLINEFYKRGANYRSVEEKMLIESTIREFFHESTIEQQLNAANTLSTLIVLDEPKLEDTMELTEENLSSLKM